MLLTSMINYGYRATTPHMLGAFVAFVSLYAVVYFGVSFLVQYSYLKVVLNVLGVMCILYLALKIMKNARNLGHTSSDYSPLSIKKAFFCSL